MVDVWLIILAVICPFVLTFLNVVILARYIDPAHAKGHYLSKAVIVRRGALPGMARSRSLSGTADVLPPCSSSRSCWLRWASWLSHLTW